MKRILFVCTGNTCRSPMAEGFLKSMLEKEPSLSGQFYASSAGISAFDGDSASREAVSVMKSAWGVDISGHRSIQLTDKLVEDSFLILAMAKSHRDFIRSSFPGSEGKIYTLKEYAQGASTDIADPYGGSSAAYGRCAAEIKQAVESLVEKLKKSQ